MTPNNSHSFWQILGGSLRLTVAANVNDSALVAASVTGGPDSARRGRFLVLTLLEDPRIDGRQQRKKVG